MTKEKVKGIIDFYEDMIAKMPGHIYWKDLNGNYLGCNDEQARALGLNSRQDVINTKAYASLDKKNADKFRKIDESVLNEGKTITIEEIWNDRIYLTKKTPLYSKDNKIVGLLGISFDITEKRRREKLILGYKNNLFKEKIKTMEMVAGNMAHELRTPLTAIDNIADFGKYLDELIQGYEKAVENKLHVPDDPIGKDVLHVIRMSAEKIKNEAYYAEEIINSLLMNIKTLNSSTKEQYYKIISINECIFRAIDRYPFSNKEKLLVSWDDKNDFVFKGERIAVEHILFNLFKNALFYINKARKGSIKIWCDTKLQKYNRLHFKDTGTGMGKNVLDNLFKPFFTSSNEGTGLGLAFCKMAMERIDGKLECSSKAGEYTEFVLSFVKEKNRK